MIARFLVTRYLNGRQPLSIFAMEATERHLPAHDGATGWAKDRVIIAALHQDEPEDGGRFRISFVPGETGYENYFFDDDFRKTVAALIPRGPETTFFGPKINTWALCAGTPGRWRALEVTVEDMQAATLYFGQVVDQIRSAGKIVSTVSDSST